MTRYFCAHTPPNVTESCECGNAYGCHKYPEEARQMRLDRDRDNGVRKIMEAFKELDREGRIKAMKAVEKFLSEERALPRLKSERRA